GFDDLVLGAVFADGSGNAKTNAGETWAVFGHPGRLPSSIDLFSPPANARAVYGADANDLLGVNVAAGDVNGDGFADLVLGASGGAGPLNTKSSAGENHVVNGVPSTTYWNKAETFAFVDASAGTDLALTCDDCSATVPIGF